MDYIQTLQEMQDYYSNLLIIQYNGKPKAKATIELITRLIYSNMALLQIRDAFDWRTADLAQLEIIGQWVGVDRAYTKNNTWTKTYLSYPSYNTENIAVDDPQRGGYSDYYTFDYDDATIAAATNAYIVEGETEYSSTWLSDTDGGDPITPTVGTFYKVLTEGDFENKVYCWNNNHYEIYFSGGVLTYKDLQSDSQKLPLEDYRTVIGLKIIKNSIVHNQGNIDEAIWQYFGGNTFYSESEIQVDDVLYSDEACTKVYGTVSALSGSNITVEDENGNTLYSGLFNYYQKDNIYYYNLGKVYTTWNIPHVITYHYPLDMAEIFNACYYKGVLLAPTGVDIQLSSY